MSGSPASVTPASTPLPSVTLEKGPLAVSSRQKPFGSAGFVRGVPVVRSRHDICVPLPCCPREEQSKVVPKLSQDWFATVEQTGVSDTEPAPIVRLFQA